MPCSAQNVDTEPRGASSGHCEMARGTASACRSAACQVCPLPTKRSLISPSTASATSDTDPRARLIDQTPGTAQAPTSSRQVWSSGCSIDAAGEVGDVMVCGCWDDQDP